MTTIEQDLADAGYCRSPNVPIACLLIDDQQWYPAGPGIPEPLAGCDVHVNESRIAVVRPHYGDHSDRSRYTAECVAQFGEVSQLIEWCREHGRISMPGLPAFSNSWD